MAKFVGMKLREWLDGHKVKRTKFAVLLDVHAITVTKWCTGEWVPSTPMIERIEQATEGAVTANDHVAAWQERQAARAAKAAAA